MNKDFKLIAEAYLKVSQPDGYDPALFGTINDWGDIYEPLKQAIDNCLNQGFKVNQLLNILKHAEEYGYVGDPLPDNYLQPFSPSNTKCFKDLEFAVRQYYERGLQDS